MFDERCGRYLFMLGGVVLILVGAVMGDDWPQWRGENRDGVWRETGIIQRFEQTDIKAQWRVDISSG